MRKFGKLVIAAAAVIGLAACGNQTTSSGSGNEKETIRVATSFGPYSDLFFNYVQPELEAKGYKIEEINFTDLKAVDEAIGAKEADVNVEQHSLYARSNNNDTGNDLVAVQAIPTLPAALFSAQKDSLEAVSAGDKIGVPEDPSNLNRALLILEKAGWITLNDVDEDHLYVVSDIKENKVGIEVVAMNSPSIPSTMPDLAYAVLPGSVAYDAGVSYDKSLLLEDIKDDLLLQVVVRGEDKDQQWVKDIVEVYKSDAFKDKIEAENAANPDVKWTIPE